MFCGNTRDCELGGPMLKTSRHAPDIRAGSTSRAYRFLGNIAGLGLGRYVGFTPMWERTICGFREGRRVFGGSIMWIASYTCCLFSGWALTFIPAPARRPPSLTHISSSPWDQKKPTYSLIIRWLKRFRLLRSMLPFRGLSVCLCAKTAEDIDTISFAYDSPMSLLHRESKKETLYSCLYLC